MKKYFFLLLAPMLAMTVFSCQQTKKDSYTINGDVAGLTDPYIYLSSSVGDSMRVDSAAVKDGKFTFTGKADHPAMAALYLKDRRSGVQFYLQNAGIKISGNVDSLDKATITGSPTQDDFEAYKASIKEYTTQEDSAYGKYQTARQMNDTATTAAIEKQVDSLDKLIEVKTKSFIADHPKSYVSLGRLQTLTYSTAYADLNKMFTSLDTSLQNSATGKKMAEQLAKMKKTAVGQNAPLFTLNDVNGKPVSLSDFKGKYVLVDFWASWCGPCRAENPNVVKTFNQYKSKNFTVLGVSLDNDKAAWQKAIDHDKLAWTQVSDLKGWGNEVAMQYGVRAIPANFLIDPNGVIVAHNLRGADLSDKLAEVLK
ncbi:redoxin domain-containing protein [Arachidicoccus sp.]|uniref:redoxin domain-containing protein n=1 Tax=Arachidicoccus sp. TaxID=1872624 RepID=UPI003D242ADC